MSADTGGAAVTPLDGEGEIKIVLKTKCRRHCDNCGEPATKRITFLLENARRNPGSSAYGRDDCSYCADAEAFTCDECERTVQRNAPPGMDWCGTFFGPRATHYLLFWHEQEVTADHAIAMLPAALAGKDGA